MFLENKQLHRSCGHFVVLNGVPASGLARSLRADSDWLAELLLVGYEVAEPLPLVTYRARRNGENLDVRGEVEFNTRFACNRCGELRTHQGRLPFAALFLPKGKVELSEGEHDHGDEDEPGLGASDELFIGEIKDGRADIAAAIVDAVVLGQAPYPVCSDDCRGLCAGCGVNLNHERCACAPLTTDHRWAKLAAVRLGRTDDSDCEPEGS